MRSSHAGGASRPTLVVPFVVASMVGCSDNSSPTRMKVDAARANATLLGRVWVGCSLRILMRRVAARRPMCRATITMARSKAA